MEISVFRVANLLFENTELGLQHQLEDYPGIESVSVNIASGIATVRHDPTVLSRGAVRRAIADCGYWTPETDTIAAGKAHGLVAGSGGRAHPLARHAFWRANGPGYPG